MNTTKASTYQGKPTIALVVPCFNEQEVLPESANILLDVLNKMTSEGIANKESFILFVNDGSKDNTWCIIKNLHDSDPRFKAISLAHNRGQQSAMLAGLLTAKNMCDAAITVDADLQDSPDAIIEMVKKFAQGTDIVYGVRSSRATDSWAKRFTARTYYKLQAAFGLDTVYDHSEFRLMSRRALEMLSDYDERTLYLRGIMPHIGLISDTVSYDRRARLAGNTKYSPIALLSVAIDGITAFTAKPMRIIFSVGAFLLILDIIVAIYVLVSYLRGNAVSGWSSLMLSVWFLGSLILISLGIVGEYIGKIFVEVKHRPRYAIMEQLL